MKTEQALLNLCEQEKPVGGNLVLFNDKEILYSFNYGYSDREAGIKSTSDSLYMIGSNTKLMTSLGIFHLIEQGQLSLDDDIRTYIPEFSVKSTFDYDKITIRNLLMHRSGLTSDLFPLILDENRDYHEVIEAVKDTYLSSMPGEMFSYSNIGFTLLGIILERVSGLSYAEYIKKTIADPLGIRIHFLASPEERAQHASDISWCYDPQGNRIEDALHTLIPAGSNTYISLNDFVKFGQIFLNKDHTIFKRETLELMEQLCVAEPIDLTLTNVGHGMFHNQHDLGASAGKILGHTGNTICHHSMFHYLPEHNVAVFAVTNSLQTTKMTSRMGMMVLTEYLQQNGLLSEAFPQYTYADDDCSRYTGKYSTLLGNLSIYPNENGELCIDLPEGHFSLRPCDDGYLHCIPCISDSGKSTFDSSNFDTSIRILLTMYAGREVLIREDRDRYDRIASIIGARYEEVTIPDSFIEACGEYEPCDPLFCELGAAAFLYLEDNTMLQFKVQIPGMLLQGCLKPVNETLAFAQGYGRNSRQAFLLHNGNKDIGEQETRITYAGITFRKKS